MALSTVTLFKQDFSGTSYTDTQIENALDLSTAILENYCNRTFGSTEYIDYLDGNGDGFLILSNYPITRVYDIAPDLYDIIKLSVVNTVYSLNYYSDNTSLYLTVTDFDGAEVTTTLAFADYPRVSQLVVAINLIAEVTATNSSSYDNEQSKKLKPDNGMIIGGQTDWLRMYKTDLQMKWIIEDGTYNVVKVDRGMCGFHGSAYVRYMAGYTLPTDAPAVAGNVPLDLTNICNKLAYTLLAENTDGIKNANYKSETLVGDYSYTKFDDKESSVVKLMLDEDAILSKYIYKTVTF